MVKGMGVFSECHREGKEIFKREMETTLSSTRKQPSRGGSYYGKRGERKSSLEPKVPSNECESSCLFNIC